MNFVRNRSALRQVILILIGNVIYAAGTVLFIEPSGLIMGGVTGLALFASHTAGLSVSLVVLVLNTVFLLLGLVFLGKQFAAETLLCSFSFPAALELVNRCTGKLTLTDEPMLCAIFGGILIGASIGLIIRCGASTGGMDIPPLMLQKYLGVPVSVGMWGFDCAILLLQSFSCDSETILYGILLVILYTYVLDKTLLMGKSRVQIKVISGKANEIRRVILSDIDRGVTLIHGQNGYTGTETEILLSVLSARELPRTEQLIHSIDPEAFVIVSKVTEVRGRGFSEQKQYL